MCISILPHQKTDVGLQNIYYSAPASCSGKPEVFSTLMVWKGTEDKIEKYLIKNVPIKSEKTINL